MTTPEPTTSGPTPETPAAPGHSSLGAALAAREGKLLALATGTFVPEGRWRRAAQVFSAAVAAAVSSLLFRAGLDLVLIEKDAGTEIAIDPRPVDHLGPA